MKIHISTLAVCAVLAAAAFAQAPGSFFQSCRSGYSSSAVSLNDAFDHPVRATSPDGKKILIARMIQDDKDPDGIHISYKVRVGGRTLTTKLLGFNGEVAWSPDSRAFAVNQTEGGGSLGARYVFFVEDDGLHKLDVSAPIEKDFGHPVRCEVKVAPNTGFVSWQPDSSTLLVAAEVVPVSICKCMGSYRLYEINLPSLTIARTYSQTEAKRQFKDLLGCELQNSDNSCSALLERNIRRQAQTVTAK